MFRPESGEVDYVERELRRGISIDVLLALVATGLMLLFLFGCAVIEPTPLREPNITRLIYEEKAGEIRFEQYASTHYLGNPFQNTSVLIDVQDEDTWKLEIKSIQESNPAAQKEVALETIIGVKEVAIMFIALLLSGGLLP